MNFTLLLSNPKRGVRFLISIFYNWLAGKYAEKASKTFARSKKMLDAEPNPVMPEEVIRDVLFQRELAIGSLADDHIQMAFYIIKGGEQQYDENGEKVIPLNFNVAYAPPKTFDHEIKFITDRTIVLRKNVREVKEFVVDVLLKKENDNVKFND